MKIMVNEKDKKSCYVQLRDLYYLSARFKSSSFENLYEKYIQQGLGNADFVFLDDSRVVEVIEFNPFIVDFSIYANNSVGTLIRLAALTAGPVVHADTVDGQHKRDDIFDIIEYKRGQLEYQIPVVFDRKKYVDMGRMILGSTNHPGFYMLKRKDVEVNLEDVVNKDYRVLFETLGLVGECTGVSMFNVDEDIVFKFKTKNKKKSIKEHLKKKLR